MGKKYSLTLDKEFIQYCKLNDIEDVEKYAKWVFTKGFSLVKYGDRPKTIKPIVEGKTKSNVKNPTGGRKAPPPPPPKPQKNPDKKETLYDE